MKTRNILILCVLSVFGFLSFTGAGHELVHQAVVGLQAMHINLWTAGLALCPAAPVKLTAEQIQAILAPYLTPDKQTQGLRERNRKVLEHVAWKSKEQKRLQERMKSRFGIDIRDAKKFPVMESGFNWSKLRQKLEMREADSASSFSQFLIAGLQTVVNNLYSVDASTTFEDWATVVPSKKAVEPYAPNQGVAFPRQVGPSEIYPEVGAAALDLDIKNYKFGTIYAVEDELLEDDQTGTFQRNAGTLVEYMKLLQEVWVYGKFVSVDDLQYADLQIPTSETVPDDFPSGSGYPWATAAAPMPGGGYNRPATFTLPTKTAIQNAMTAIAGQKNLLGLKMSVNLNRIIAGPANQWDLAILLNSQFYPAGAEAAGVTGGAFAINPLKSIAQLTITRWLPNYDGTFNSNTKAWYMVDQNKPFFVLQVREAATMVQEAPNSGEGFTKDIKRFKCRSRQNADWIDPRFAWQGNDGSVTS